MACASLPSSLAMSPEKIHASMLRQLIVDGGTHALRRYFFSRHPEDLTFTFSRYRSVLSRLRHRVITSYQWDKLYPAGSYPNIEEFDIALLYVLLRNICGLSEPFTGWYAMPPQSDNSPEANIVRIKCFRNEMYVNVSDIGVSATQFESYWREISSALVGLGTQQSEIDKLKLELEQPLISGVPVICEDETSDVQWRSTSTKHRVKFEKLIEILKNEPSRATKIGIYRVCFHQDFAIGDGCHGTVVYIGLSDDGFEVAVKSIPIKLCKKLGTTEQNVLNCPNVKESPHIVNYRYYTDSFDARHAYLVLDLHEESLETYISEKSKDELNSNGPTIIRQILLGIEALHCGEDEILHRDLKPSNILVNSKGEMLLADFGISRPLMKGKTTYESGAKGTEDWIAVESIPVSDDDSSSDEEAVKQVRYKKQSDIQVTGMLSFHILTKGKHPYGRKGHRRDNLLKGNPVKLDKLDEQPVSKDLIEWMLQHNPKNRPAVQQCLKHPYLLTTDEQFDLVTCVGNQPEVEKNKEKSSLVTQLNSGCPLLPKRSWEAKIDLDLMRHARDFRPYSDGVADLLRLIRNVHEHWQSLPTFIQNEVVNPKHYFLKLFPTLPVALHKIIREESKGERKLSQRENLKQFFPST